MLFHRLFWDFQEDVGNWGDTTFPNSNQQSIIAHLKKEVVELSENNNPVEVADCLLLLLYHAHKGGYDLFQEAQKKFEIVKTRKWGKPDKDGVVEHIRE